MKYNNNNYHIKMETIDQFKIRHKRELESELIKLKSYLISQPLNNTIKELVRKHENTLMQNYPDSDLLKIQCVLESSNAIQLSVSNHRKHLTNFGKNCLKSHCQNSEQLTSQKSEQIVEPVNKNELSGEKKNVKKKKKTISSTIKKLVWNTNIGEEIGKSKCYCCKSTDITQISFNCGHVIAEANQGETIVSNLKPICQNCNSSMGTKNMNEFMISLK